jgi:C4-dicarboxylate-specific signal transduction histidine kinase
MDDATKLGRSITTCMEEVSRYGMGSSTPPSRIAASRPKVYSAMQICNDIKWYDRFFIGHSTARYAKLSASRPREAQAELAHVTRVTTLGELTASIAHEVNQPLAGIVANAEACLGWLDRETPCLNEVRRSVEWIIEDSNRAGEVIRRVRALATKTDAQKAPLDVNHAVNEAIALVQREMLSHRVSLRMELSRAPPVVLADRVQLQQVIINLVMNAIEAMQAVTDRPRELAIRTHRNETHQILVTVKDCGVGISVVDAYRLFDAFFTTKASGMGMGLSICRSIIAAHGGRLWVEPNLPPGATFHFTLPSHQENAP